MLNDDRAEYNKQTSRLISAIRRLVRVVVLWAAVTQRVAT